MVIRLHNLDKWQKLAPGEGIELLGPHERKVRVEVNTEAPTRLDLVHGDDDDTKVTFVAVVHGMETVELYAPGGSYLAATSDGEVWYFTNEGDQIASDREAVSFTKIMNRRARNPELERMMFKMEQNMNARLALMAEEVAAQVAAAGVNHDTATGEIIDEPEEPTDDNSAVEEPPADGGGAGDGVEPTP